MIGSLGQRLREEDREGWLEGGEEWGLEGLLQENLWFQNAARW